MKTRYAWLLCSLFLLLALGCSNCRWPWEHRTVTTQMPPVTCAPPSCACAGATISAPPGACAPALSQGAMMMPSTPAPAAAPAPAPGPGPYPDAAANSPQL